MAREDNLIKNSDRTPEERQEIARKGGKASGEARRRKKTMKQSMEELLNMSVKHPEIIQQIAAATDYSDGDVTYQAAVNFAMIQQAMAGNVKAKENIDDLMGVSIRAEQLKETKRANKAREKLMEKQLEGTGKSGDVEQVEAFKQLVANGQGKGYGLGEND